MGVPNIKAKIGLSMNNQYIKQIGVFCGSNPGHSPFYRQMAEQLADVLTENDLTLVYGGSVVGLMGAIANRMLMKGGRVIGVIPRMLVDVELAHHHLTELHVVDSMHERKLLMNDLADAFMMLPGGFGSLDEFFEVLTLTQLGQHQKPSGILNVNGYYDHLLQCFDHMVAEGFMNQPHREMVLVDDSPSSLLKQLQSYVMPLASRWVEKPAAACA